MKDGKSENAKEVDAKLKDYSLVEKRTGLELANSLANGQSTMASLKDMSQRMFQVRKQTFKALNCDSICFIHSSHPPHSKSTPQVPPGLHQCKYEYRDPDTGLKQSHTQTYQVSPC